MSNKPQPTLEELLPGMTEAERERFIKKMRVAFSAIPRKVALAKMVEIDADTDAEREEPVD